MTVKKTRLVVIGNGMAGIRTIEELIKMSPDEFDITVFGSEPKPNYNRILLSPVLSGEMMFQDTVLNDWNWYEENHITLQVGKTVTKIDRFHCQVETQDGITTPYDRLLIATGSNPIMLPIPGINLPGVLAYRSIDDVEKMLAATKICQRAVVIGGGLLGLEAANGLALQGMDVSVVHLCDWPMERQLDKVGGDLLKAALEKRGLKFYLSRETQAILGEDKVTGLSFKDGEQIAADLIIMAAGIRPNIALAKNAGIHCERGIVVSDTMQTYDPKIYAVGECVQHRGQTYGLVAPLFEQAKVAANHLARYGRMLYEGSAVSTKLKVTGIDLFSAGDFNVRAGDEELLLQDAARGVYKKLVLRNNKLRGAVMYGETVDGPWYFQLMREATDVSELREHLLFGQVHLGDAGRGGASNVASMADSAEICGCNGVCKSTIVKAIIGKKLFTLEEVRSHTKASASCGSCTGLVEALLANTLGGDYSAQTSKKPICSCTDHPHQDVRDAILKLNVKNIPDLMRALNWKTEDGCHVCRPALNYYMTAAYPGVYEDDSRSRFINERVHANIQKDGTYSVIPRIWGGVTSPKELRTIAEIAEKYEVPTVHITGGQRIGLYGVTKENLPKMWGDLVEGGFVSGHAYGKSLRTVKTCVGSDWCRFGTQDSTGLGITVEKMTWGSWTPHKFKIAVSGCPRNCAEATIKDFGIVCVDSGYEIHVGGNGGMKVRVTDFLCKVESEAEVLEYCGAYMQLYREEAHYMERTAPWIERVGLAYIKQHIVEDAKGRANLYARFLESQRYSQNDPWKERAQGKDAHEYTTLATLA
ncbi:MAG: nitrite reductase large subunit [Ferrovum sp. 37-45-19]|nr:MAG: nitrite reductase large subunit [Ferrovum sp. 21-44-67]OYV94983.1 MAG: nitrite reductase large subunit [Ferrovum sp. 37-45-19]OZB34228.1 MAG: nitrite reductase large subunit [Ferrovum sp. 34-44-207]HQT80962.1 nitrite reductase large subunit NirB [Ferrovaceae bacterium]HQU06964.1 nitrite reductase large subunit NirB [Ferrovaceae bacterium]